MDIEAGERIVDFIRGMESNAVGRGIGGFAAAVPIPVADYRRPLLLTTTDGVGTKILVARALGDYSTIGIDLVAMNVNDLAVCGARPVSFLDYIACGSIREPVLQDVIRGVAKGCELANCELVGGETAELPDMYGPDDIDLAGFCAGVVEADELLPHTEAIEAGARLFGLPSSGIHSNGLTLARKALADSEAEVFSQLLTPTRIYVRELTALLASGTVQAAAHVTGGGIVSNLSRVIPKGLVPRVSWEWAQPPIFEEIRRAAEVSVAEMQGVFNMGIGIVLVVNPRDEDKFENAATHSKIETVPVGVLDRG